MGGMNPQFQPAGFMRRLAAGVYDAVLILALLIVLSLPVVIWVYDGEAVPTGEPLYQLGVLATISAFFIGFWLRGGQTLGMQAWKIRVVDQQGGPIGLHQAMLRLLGTGVSLSVAGLGVLWILFDADQRAWHDHLSRTRVIRLPKG